ADFPETVDGVVFGIAAGIGFSVAESLVSFSTALTSLPAYMTPGNWIYQLATLAVFQPLLQGSATGMIAAAVWRYRRGRLAGRELGAVGIAVRTRIAFSREKRLLRDLPSAQLYVPVWRAAIR